MENKNVFNKLELKRLEKLANFLENEIKDEQFDISEYRDDPFYSKHNCGTVGCALGWCPFVVKTKDSDYTKDFFTDIKQSLDFDKYSRRIFGSTMIGSDLKSSLLIYMFSADWSEEAYHLPNNRQQTRKGTIRRIREVIKHNRKTPNMMRKAEKYHISLEHC